MRREAKCFVLAVGVMLVVASALGQQFQLMEASINEIHRGLQSGKLTCHSLVQPVPGPHQGVRPAGAPPSMPCFT